MELNERYKKFPINFYQLEDGTIEYESGFTYGSANSLNSALNIFSDKDFAYDLFYFYDDVVDVKFGSFEPATGIKKSRGRKYLGKLNLELDLNNFRGPQTVTYLSKNKQYIPMYKIFIDVKSGMNFQRKDFLELIDLIIESKVSKIFIENKDRLVRFGFELLQELCKKVECEIVVVNDLSDKNFEQELTEDLLSIIHYFSMKSYSNRRKLNKLKKELMNDNSEN